MSSRGRTVGVIAIYIGIVLAFDDYCISFLSPVSGDMLIYKHAVVAMSGVSRTL